MTQEAAWIKDEPSVFFFLKEELPKHFSAGDRILVKMHMGEPGNKHYIKSPFTARIIEALKEIGCDPFI